MSVSVWMVSMAGSSWRSRGRPGIVRDVRAAWGTARPRSRRRSREAGLAFLRGWRRCLRKGGSRRVPAKRAALDRCRAADGGLTHARAKRTVTPPNYQWGREA